MKIQNAHIFIDCEELQEAAGYSLKRFAAHLRRSWSDLGLSMRESSGNGAEVSLEKTVFPVAGTSLSVSGGVFSDRIRIPLAT